MMRTLAPILKGFLAINAVAVLAAAPSLAILQQSGSGTVQQVEPPAVQPTPAAGPAIPLVEGAIEVATRDPLDNRNSESDLPDVPSLAVPSMPAFPPIDQDIPTAEALANDPVFQEIKKMFQSSETSDQSPPLLGLQNLAPSETHSNGRVKAGVPSASFFERLDSRMVTVSSLCEAARLMVQEAAMAADEGNAKESRELLAKATQLREMAAELLIRRLP